MAQVLSDNSEGKTTKHRFQYFFFLAQIFCFCALWCSSRELTILLEKKHTHKNFGENMVITKST